MELEEGRAETALRRLVPQKGSAGSEQARAELETSGATPDYTDAAVWVWDHGRFDVNTFG